MSGLENYKDLKILVTGGSGQIGSCLKQIKDDYKSIFYFPNSVVLNLKDQGSINKYIDHNKINFVINLAAYTNVDKAETEKDESNLINNIAPTLIAKECKKREIPLIHFSTDYVFGGEGVGPFQPNDKKFPVNEYGRSKSLGEDNILFGTDFPHVESTHGKTTKIFNRINKKLGEEKASKIFYKNFIELI